MHAREDEFINCEVRRYSAEENIFIDDSKSTSIERVLDIFLNGEKFSVSFCSPGDVEDLITGILAQAGKIRSIDDVIAISVDVENFVAEVTTTADAILWAEHSADNPRYFSTREILTCAPELIFERPRDVRFVAKDILACADELLTSLAVTHGKTNGVHCGAIFDQSQRKILVFREDVGRHNVFDKLYGWSIRNRVDITDKIIIFSGRCSCEMMLKLGRMGISSVLAKSVPTTLSISIANKLGITLAARLAAGSFCIYTNPQRIVL